MKHLKLLLFLLVTNILNACSADLGKIETELEALLQIDIPHDFKVVNYNEGGLNDYDIRYDLEFNKNNFNQLLQSINLKEWDSS